MFRVPFDLTEAFGRARPPLRVTIRGHTWRTTPGMDSEGEAAHAASLRERRNRWGVGHIVVNREVKSATGVDAGDRVQVAMSLDTAPGTVRIPSDLRRALDEDSAAQASFSKMSYTHRREYVDWIQEAKRPETRARRVAKTVERVREGKPRR